MFSLKNFIKAGLLDKGVLYEADLAEINAKIKAQKEVTADA